jgi:predicted nucleic acid-binding protein
MRLVVADTSPIFYLLSIGHINLLPQLFGKVFLPDAVHTELCHPSAPAVVRDWVAGLPSWVEVTSVEAIDDATLQLLGAGERAAITLALSLHADLILIDERKGTAVALGKGFDGLAARRGLIDLADSFARLKRTNFRYRQEIMDELLNRKEGESTDRSPSRLRSYSRPITNLTSDECCSFTSEQYRPGGLPGFVTNHAITSTPVHSFLPPPTTYAPPYIRPASPSYILIPMPNNQQLRTNNVPRRPFAVASPNAAKKLVTRAQKYP